MPINSLKELDDIDKMRKERRKRVLSKKPALMHIEHIDYLANLKRLHASTQKTLSLDDGNNAKLKDFMED